MTHDTYIFVKLRNGGAVLADLIVKNNAKPLAACYCARIHSAVVFFSQLPNDNTVKVSDKGSSCAIHHSCDELF